MKKDRNCNGGATPYPIYPPYPMGMQMGQGVPAMMPSFDPNMMMSPNPYNNLATNNTTLEQQISNLSNQISSLERRVNNLENLIGTSSTQYNTSNYQIM